MHKKSEVFKGGDKLTRCYTKRADGSHSSQQLLTANMMIIKLSAKLVPPVVTLVFFITGTSRL